jgi:hypothetical protein
MEFIMPPIPSWPVQAKQIDSSISEPISKIIQLPKEIDFPTLASDKDGRIVYPDNWINTIYFKRDEQPKYQLLEGTGIVADTARFISPYMVMGEAFLLAGCAWAVAAHSQHIWDKFAHLAITGPDGATGKTQFLNLLSFVSPNTVLTNSLTVAVTFRKIEKAKGYISFLIDESDFLKSGSEAAAVYMALLKSSIERRSVALRCAGADWNEEKSFSTYCPKAFALRGHIEENLADRCFPIRLKRKLDEEIISELMLSEVDGLGKSLREKILQWSVENAAKIQKTYTSIQRLKIKNNRMADLLKPLQTILTLIGDPYQLCLLEQYAHSLDKRDKKQAKQSDGVKLLIACKEIFEQVEPTIKDGLFIPTEILINELLSRKEEGWNIISKGYKPITSHKLANMLFEYDVEPEHNHNKTIRGYYAAKFDDAWRRYLPRS